MSDDIGVNALGEVEANRHTPRIRIGIVIRNQRKARRIREANGHRRRFPLYMGCAGEGIRAARGRKRSRQQGAFGMGRAKARMQSEDGIELPQQIVTQSDELLVRGKWHKVLMYSRT